MQQASPSGAPASNESPLVARITQDPNEVHQALQLRYRVFAEGMGANIEGGDEGIDMDRFDDIAFT